MWKTIFGPPQQKYISERALKKGTHTYRINKAQAAAITAENRFSEAEIYQLFNVSVSRS